MVLAHLVLRANQVVSTDQLINLVWGEDPPEAARNSLQSYVSHLRTTLGSDVLKGRSGGYLLHVDPTEVDALRFEVLVTEARGMQSSDPERAVELFREALSLWRGPVLSDLADEASLVGDLTRLEELRLSALEDRFAAELAAGRAAEAVPELEVAATAYPLRERLWAHLMLALYRSGRQADALASFTRARRVLSEDLGIDPSPELLKLHERILRQDRSLEVAGRALRGYRPLERVGEGAFAVVWRGIQPQVDREVAVKAIHAHLANDPEFIRRLEAEAQVVARLEHPRIVPLYEYWREPDGAYLVMRYFRGGSLSRALAAGPLEPARVLRVVDQIAEALDAAHRQGVRRKAGHPPKRSMESEISNGVSETCIMTCARSACRSTA